MIKTEIVQGKIDPFPSEDNHTGEGAEVIFNGRVRKTEHGKPIVALEYEQYEGMAGEELEALAKETLEKFPIHDLLCRHRVGEVPVGESSLHISIWALHRKESLDALSWFISELKKWVPIWKWAVYPDGTKEATSHEC